MMLTASVISVQRAQAQDSDGRRQIWCETIRFIYTDNQRADLVPTVFCDDSVSFVRSIQGDSLSAFSFYQSIEKPAIYAGLSTEMAKREKLIREITGKLKARRTGARAAKVDSLEQQLMALAQSEPQLGEVVQQPQPVLDTPVQATQTPAATPTEAPDYLWWLIALSVCVVGLGVALWQLLQKLNARIDRRASRDEMQQRLSYLEERLKKLESAKPPTPPSPWETVRPEVERLLDKRLRGGKSAPAPQPMPAAPPAQASPPPQREMAPVPTDQIRYVKNPNNGAFHESKFTTNRQRDSIFTIHQRPDRTTFCVTEDPEVQRYAMEYGYSFFEEACDYTQQTPNPTRIVNLERGTLQRDGSVWKIEKKAKIAFE
ncbi:hypothetical protein SAMN05421823_107127 [Catalinimonas alkaloidigena]|uniref:Uncharacterized protein n=1 Tax=Catalinimonas alkaloidigena TaxID=1075417 RepID=A0A1G9LR68_9BACT|nr:hypothetical protein [Catalinimonas alkaloidigena]SDL63945.1 hypothetical protein SAMN05421823_107127 [Catalinimonas alkaloidigena]